MKTLFHPDLPATQEVPDEAVGEWLESGWLTEPRETVVAEATYDPATANVKAVLAHVGEDSALAAEALTFEAANKARPSLIQQLEKIVGPVGEDVDPK